MNEARHHKAWSNADLRTLREMRAAGYSDSLIADTLGRSVPGLRKTCYRHTINLSAKVWAERVGRGMTYHYADDARESAHLATVLAKRKQKAARDVAREVAAARAEAATTPLWRGGWRAV